MQSNEYISLSMGLICIDDLFRYQKLSSGCETLKYKLRLLMKHKTKNFTENV